MSSWIEAPRSFSTRPLRRSIPPTTSTVRRPTLRWSTWVTCPPAIVEIRAWYRSGCSGAQSFGVPRTGIAKRTRIRSPGRSARGERLPCDTLPSGATSRTLTAGRWTLPLWFSSQPSASTFQLQCDFTQNRRGSSPASFMTTGPRATSETWRVIPPQFHHPSRSARLRR